MRLAVLGVALWSEVPVLNLRVHLRFRFEIQGGGVIKQNIDGAREKLLCARKRLTLDGIDTGGLVDEVYGPVNPVQVRDDAGVDAKIEHGAAFGAWLGDPRE